MKLIVKLSVFVVVCLSGAASRAMVRGSDVARESDYARSTVILLFGAQMRCGATIISPRHILTAAHCAKMQPGDYTVVFDPDLTSILKGERKAQGRGVINITRHPDFQKHDGLSDDLAVMELRGEIPAEALVARLPERELSIATNTVLLSLGYGARNDNGIFVPFEPIRLAKKALVTVEPSPVIFKDIDLGYRRLVVTQEDGGICQGDSGGPTYIRGDRGPVLIGVNGATVPPFDTRVNKPVCAANAYATRVDTSLRWIRSVIGQGEQAVL